MGVTIYELLVVMSLAALIFISSFIVVQNQLKKARDTKRKSHLEQIKVGLYDYFFDAGCFPASLPDCSEALQLGDTVYLSNFPCDPKGDNYGYQTDDSDCSQWFKVLANLENKDDSSIDKVGCRNGCGLDCDYNYGIASGNISLREGCVVYYACSPSGNCISFDDPETSRCPRVFENNPTCDNVCEDRKNRCHDESGKGGLGEDKKEGPTPTLEPTSTPRPTPDKGGKKN